jgi:hypothetical protein
VLACGDNGEAAELCSELERRGEQYPGNFLLISLHGDHVHVVHDCPYSNRSCRCSLLQGSWIQAHLRRAIRKRRSIDGLGEADWLNVLFYFTQNGRECKYLKIRGASRRIPVPVTNVEDIGPRGEGQIDLVGACGYDYQSDIRAAVKDGTTSRRGKRAVENLHHRPQPNRGPSIIQKIEKIMLEHPVCPMVGIVNHDEWLNDPDLMYIRKDNKIVNNVIEAWQQKICRWSVYDFNTFYSADNCTPKFWCGYRNMDDVYYDVEDSINKVEQVLKFQCDDDPLMVRQFLSDLYNVLERKIDKLGTFAIISPPNAGKNWVMEAFIHYYWNTGQLGNLTRHNQFGLQEASGKRVLLWDEPNYEPGMTETLKNVLAAHPYVVRVKKEADCAVYATPVIVLTNRNVGFLYEEAFRTRVIKYRWRACNFLKYYDKKPNPLCVYPLWLKWGIIDVNAMPSIVLPNPYDMEMSMDNDIDDLEDMESLLSE